MKKLNDIIKAQRILKNLTQSDLAEFAEININTIAKIEKDENKTSVETLRKVLDVLGLELAIVPKADAKTRFMGEHYPHLKESGISTYIIRLIEEMERRWATDGLSKKKDILKMDFNKLVVRMYNPKLKTEEGQQDFYRALKALPDVTKKMSESHIIFWKVESVDMIDDCLIFCCEKKKQKKSGLQPIPYLLAGNVSGQSDNLALVKTIVDFLKDLSPQEKTRLIDLFEIGDEDERHRSLYAFFEEKRLDEDAADVIVHTHDSQSIRRLL